MRILYTPAGSTDPIRGNHDGPMLHIVRNYTPDKVCVFLTKTMVEREEKWHCYEKSIKRINPDIEISFYKTDIENVHKMDDLILLAKYFIELKRSNEGAEFILNISSGTPQIESIMTFLAIDFPDVKAVQVENFISDSNQKNPPLQDGDFAIIDQLLDANEDDNKNINRCIEPPLKLLKRYSNRYQMKAMVENYEYSSALALYEANKEMFSNTTGKLLKHLVLRESLKTKDALEILNSYDNVSLGGSDKPEVSRINEFLMVLELRQKQNKIPDFIVKITPFLYHLTKYYLVNKMKTDLTKVADKVDGDFWKMRREKLEINYPEYLMELDLYYAEKNNFKKKDAFSDRTFLSFFNILIMMRADKNISKELITLLEELRTIENTQRNLIAHTIVAISESDLSKNGRYLSSEDIIKKLHRVFVLTMENENIIEPNIYFRLNKSILNSLDDYQ